RRRAAHRLRRARLAPAAGAVRQAERVERAGEGILCPAVPAPRLRAGGRAMAAGADRALVSRRRGAVGLAVMPAERIASYLAGLAPVADHRPWPRYEIDSETWSAIGQSLGEGGGDLIALWGDGAQVHLALRSAGLASPCVLSVGLRFGSFPSIGRHHAPALRLERSVRDLSGHAPAGVPDRRPWLDHGAWGVRAPLGNVQAAERRDPAAYEFLPVRGEGLHEIPVGPVHAGIIEPGHFR